MMKLLYTDKIEVLCEKKNRRPLLPRHPNLDMKMCCDETIYRIMYAFMDTTAENRDLIMMFTDPDISSKNTPLSRRTYFRRRDMVLKTFIPADTPDCCRKTIGRFLDFFRGCSPRERDLILHLSTSKKTLSNFKLCSRQAAARWVKEIIDTNPKYGFIRASIRHRDEGKFSDKRFPDSKQYVDKRRNAEVDEERELFSFCELGSESDDSVDEREETWDEEDCGF